MSKTNYRVIVCPDTGREVLQQKTGKGKDDWTCLHHAEDFALDVDINALLDQAEVDGYKSAFYSEPENI